jgi:hypothetical protein
MTMKQCTKSSRKRSDYQLFLPFWLYEHLQMTIKHWTKFLVSPISHLWKEVSTSYFTPSTPVESTITHTWILPSLQYTHLQMKMTLYRVPSLHSAIYNDTWTPTTPVGSITTHRKIIGSSCPDNMHTSKWQWSIPQSFKYLRSAI